MEDHRRVSDGLEAVKKARELNPDVVLLDLLLPKIDGVEAANRLRLRSNGLLGDGSSLVAKDLLNRPQQIGRHCAVRRDSFSLRLQPSPISRLPVILERAKDETEVHLVHPLRPNRRYGR